MDAVYIGDTGNLARDVTVYNQNEAGWQKMASGSVVLSDYADKLPAEARKRYIEKFVSSDKVLPDPYLLHCEWSNDPVNWPDLTFGDIYNYLIDRQSVYTKESLKAFKSLEAYR